MTSVQCWCKSNLDLDHLLDEMNSEVSYAGETQLPIDEKRSLSYQKRFRAEVRVNERDLVLKGRKMLVIFNGKLKTYPSLSLCDFTPWVIGSGSNRAILQRVEYLTGQGSIWALHCAL